MDAAVPPRRLLKIATMKGPFYTIREVKFIEQHYEQRGPAWVAERMDRNTKAITQKAQKLGLKYKGPARGFKKGHATWNKGISHSPEGSKKTWFKKGQNPTTARPMLQPYQRDEHGKMMWYIKTAEGIKPYHRFIWEVANGPIPKGYVVAFKDFDTMNLDLDNLECISRAENIRRSAHNAEKVDRSKNGYKAWKTRDRNMRIRFGLPV